MPDLGTYALPVLSSYAVSLGLLIAVIIASVWKARRVRAQLENVENRRGRSA
ncbi:heme exporter protein CcmD [Roseicyclus marinus]|uniref:heme exporter protein CcmD n=1 Tax=Roseicyclus marinus TaxID=2161673 RepID=UPI00240FF5A3|nr:heme exporter protein CcmD [Roseicyclus marinus]MDG3042423.1 heme exporter protein CcmD [Roseicyclus marinus]